MALPVFLCTVTLFSLHAVIEASSHAADPVKILVFGDSQGDVGPTYQVVEDQLKKHGRAGTVVNAAIGGTLSCGWAKDPKAVAKAAIKAFGISGPELVWLTVGANDLAADSKYHVSTITWKLMRLFLFLSYLFFQSITISRDKIFWTLSYRTAFCRSCFFSSPHRPYAL